MREIQIHRRCRDWTLDVGVMMAVYSREFVLGCTVSVFESLLRKLDHICSFIHSTVTQEMGREQEVDKLNREILFRERLRKAFPEEFPKEIDDD